MNILVESMALESYVLSGITYVLNVNQNSKFVFIEIQF